MYWQAPERERMRCELCRIEMCDKLLVKTTSSFQETMSFLRLGTERLLRDMSKSAADLRQVEASQSSCGRLIPHHVGWGDRE